MTVDFTAALAGAPPTRAQLRAHLVEARLAGDIATPRDNNLRAMRRLADRDERSWFGLRPDVGYPFSQVLRVMVERVGVHPDPAYRTGGDHIDPERTLDALAQMGKRLRRAARKSERVFIATGHPAGVFAIHVVLAGALAAAGCEVLTPSAGAVFDFGDGNFELRYVHGVAMLSSGGELKHSHSAVPMKRLLADGLDAQLVIADHGWAGAAGQAGYDVVCFADCNDPALFVGAQEGHITATVPIDDNVLPHLYEPVSAYLLGQLG
ncbi:MAG: phosphatase [Mycobacteriales bacterium]|nr:phosphatase [Frankia sp.]